MEKDATTVQRRHRLGPGAPPLGVASGHVKATSEMAELQRSRSVGGLHQKGDPPSRIQKLCKELGNRRTSQGLGSAVKLWGCQANLEEDKQEKNQDALGKSDHESGKMEPEVEKSDSEASGEEEQEEEESTEKRTQEAKVRPWSFNIHVLLPPWVGVPSLLACLVSSYRNKTQSP
ncbi:hypothetical protein PAL_GLEAN10013680 [Pteropus alecto]|uniref:Uncharacterized protein n=1 Tax=Pteropus alecto TaxID=9402 RepID=L5KUJ0_PTEAL|nr:hypothetical protein PAL_GLEAN10013680 [Pteropus alecto]